MVELLKAYDAAIEEEASDAARIGDLVSGALKRAAESFIAHDSDRTPEHRNAEDLHDARVALRRARSFLRTFWSVVDQDWAGTVRSDLGWFAGLLGEVRNLDVLARRITERAESPSDPFALEELLGVVSYCHNDAVFRLAEARVTPRYDSVLGEIDVLASQKVPLSSRADEAVSIALPDLMKRPWRNVGKATRKARRAPNEANLHKLRIRSKELRYASEVASEVVGRPGQKLASSARKIQDSLGEHRDALAAVAFMTMAAADHPACAFFAGQLVAIERINAQRALEKLEKNLTRLKGRWGAFERALVS